MVGIGGDVPLVGRVAELHLISEALASAATGRGQLVVVEGEAGVGKTRLIDAAADQADGLGMQVFRAHAEEFESRRPFGAVADCLGVTRSATDPRRAEISRRLHGGAGAEETAGSEFRLVEDMVALVEDLCADGPVVVALDDIQWADPGTLLVAHGLARAAPALPLLVILACRPAPRSAELARLLQTLAERGAAYLRLAPLAADEVVELVAGLLGTPPGPRLARQVGDAGGNPFFVTELVGALVADGSVHAEGATAEIASVAFPVALKPIVLHRMSFLSRDTLDVLSVASVLGSTFTVPTLSLALGRAALDLLPRVREALDGGVLGEDGDGLAFRHDLLREALYEDIPRAVRVGVHRDIGHALAAAGAPPVAVAEHFLRGECRGDPVALDWLQRAVEEATVRAPATAAKLLESTLELADADDPGRDRLLGELVVVLIVSGQGEQAERVCLDLLTRAQPPIAEARLRMTLARLAASRGELDEALEQAARAEAIAGLSPQQRARLLGTSSVLALTEPRLDVAEAMATRSLRVAEEVGGTVARATSAYTLGRVAYYQGRFDDALSWFDQCRLIGDDEPGDRIHAGWQQLRFLTDLFRILVLLQAGRADPAVASLADHRRLTLERGYTQLHLRACWLQALGSFLAGRWDDAAGQLEEVEGLFDGGRLSDEMLASARGMGALIALHRGDAGTAERIPILPAKDVDDGDWPALAAALRAEADGAPADALEVLAAGWRRAEALGLLVRRLWNGPEIVRLALGRGPGGPVLDQALAEEVCVAVEALVAGNEGVATVVAAALRCRGLIGDDGDVLTRAAAAYRDAGRPLEAARAAEDAGAAFGRSGDQEAAQRLFEEAAQGYERLDASWDVARVGASMRAFGLRRRRAAPRPRRVGWDALSRGEQAVAELVATGLSNPEIAERLFLSRYTVRSYVSIALSKLSLTSRVELAQEVIRRQGNGPAEAAGPQARGKPGKA
jgi:DNA-binding CsgD family transcriptional regulator